jgi:hypothetical protein
MKGWDVNEIHWDGKLICGEISGNGDIVWDEGWGKLAERAETGIISVYGQLCNPFS